ncbi:unnamed protein product [Rotaria sordida]|uniref:Uncharacterized protein n=1 Tax=Rotaria sordida TaxID=392033 RepID=A0A813RZ83_9BILA|nr:unnamed protein product [Rotaria sordida]
MARQSPFMSSAQFTYPTSYQQRDARYAGNSTVETAMALNRRPSLLASYHNHFGSPERATIPSYYPSLAPISMGPHVDEHSKRSRYLAGGNLSINSQLLPLSIDVKKEQQVYQPQTEAISPTPDDPKNDSNMRDSTIIRNAISKLESEIDLTMKKLDRAKLSQSEIKSQADKSAADEEDNDDQDDFFRINGSQTLIEKILHDNRKKAEDSQKMLNHLNNNLDLTIPLYQEPSDLESIRKIRIQYINIMKNHLKDFFKKKNEIYKNRIKYESNQYDKNYQQWQKLIENDEKIILNKDLTTYRETFEKIFPELRKTREDKEKKQININDTITSEQQITINTNTIEQDIENEEEKMRKSSIVPPIIYDKWQRKYKYFNENSLIKRDAAEFYKELTKMPYWSSEEKQIFIEKFTQSPKNFGYISSFLENKTTEQCVQFYYMTKKSENYKNLLRKQAQANRRKAKQNTTTTTTVTSSTTIETTLVTKFTSSNTILSSTSQQILPQITTTGGQDGDRSTDRLENDEERRETNPGDGNEEKRANKNRCQLLSCTTEKLGKKKNRKNRLRAFPSKWNELTQENQEAIRRSLQIPQNVQRCCTRCYEKLIIQVRQRQTTTTTTTTQQIEEEEDDDDDDDDESSKIQSTITDEQNLKHDDEWTEHEIDAFTEAFHKFRDDWAQIAQYVHRSEQSCRIFYQKYRKKNGLADDEHNIEEDNASISGSEDTSRRLIIPIKSQEREQIDEENDDDPQKTNINDDSNDSTHGMIIDEGDEQPSIIQDKNENIQTSAGLTTINSLVEIEISKTLNETDKRLLNTNISSNKIQLTLPLTTISSNNSTRSSQLPPPPLVTLNKSHSPSIHSYSSHNQQTFSNKGSIMRGTPISPSNKSISIDTSTTHSHIHSQNYSSPKTEYSHHPSTYIDSSHIKSSKILDQQQQHLYLQQQQQQQTSYMRHYPHQQTTHNNFSTPTQYLQPHKSSSINNQQQQQQQQQQTPTNTNKSIGIDTSNTDTYETLRADFVTSRYLTTGHSPNHERQSRHPSEQRSPSQSSSNNQQLLPPPTAIVPSTSNPSIQSSSHSQQQQQAALLAASHILASSGVYPQELLTGGLLPYPHYYNSLPGASFYIDPRLMHDLTTVANNEQLKNLRTNRHLSQASTQHSPPDPSTYSTQSSKRHSYENIEHTRYSTGDYATPIWRTQNLNSTQQQQQQQQQQQKIHSQLKSNSSTNENPFSKLNDLSRSSTRITSATDRDTRSPEDFHHRINQPRTTVESSSIHFPRVDTHIHHKSSSSSSLSSHEKLNTNLHFSDHSTDNNPSSYIRQSTNVHKPHANHPSQQQQHSHHTSTSTNRPSLVPTSQISPHHASPYMFHNLHSSSVSTISPKQQSHYNQQRLSHHNDSIRNSKEPISIQEFMKQNVNDFVALTNNDNKTQNSDLSISENSTNPLSRIYQPTTIAGIKPIDNSDQPILLDGDDDSNSIREQTETMTDGNSKIRSNQDVNKSTIENEMPERRRDSSIKKILSNQPLEKQEYVEINQKVQNSTVSASKVHSSNDLNVLERTNSTGGRESTRSRGSITMRMLMGANGIYADGKAQPMTANELTNEQSNKRAASPNDKSQSLEYLIRGELVRACPTLPKNDESSMIFQNRNPSNRLSPTIQQRIQSNQQQQQQQQQPISKRMRTSSKDESTSNTEQRHSSFSQTHETSTNVRDPFILQSHSKNSHQQMSSSLSSSSNTDRNWQSYVQQQYQQSLASRSTRSTITNSGSITQGSPISPPTRSSNDQQQYSSTASSQLVNSRYASVNKNEQQFSPSRQSSTSPLDHSSKGKFSRRAQQILSSPVDTQHESTLSINIDPSSSHKSPNINSLQTNTPPIAASPISSSVSPATSVSSNSAHPLKKRLLSEYEFEQQQQQRNSPTMISPVISTQIESTEELIHNSNSNISEQNTEETSNTADTTKTTMDNSMEKNESST